jgi:hypothetical protein
MWPERSRRAARRKNNQKRNEKTDMSHFKTAIVLLVIMFALTSWVAEQLISGLAFSMINRHTSAVRSSFYVNLHADAGYDNGFVSGSSASQGNLGIIHIDKASGGHICYKECNVSLCIGPQCFLEAHSRT